MAESVVEPRVDDFGITEEDLNRVPCLFLEGHRPLVIVVAYLVAAGFLFVLLLNASGSPAGVSVSPSCTSFVYDSQRPDASS